MHSAAHGDMGPQCGSNIEGRLSGLDADMQQQTACRKDEGDRVRRVAPKLIANGESHALKRGTSPARGLRIGLSRGGEARGDGGEGGVLVGGGARLRKSTRKKS